MVCECGFEACRECVKRYILNPSLATPQCMACKAQWSRTFLFDAMGQKFMSKDFKNHREAIILEREMSLMPQTQPYLELELKKESWKRELAEIRANKGPYSSDRERELRLKIKTARVTHEDVIILACPREDCRGFVSGSTHSCKLCGTEVCKNCNETLSPVKKHICDKRIVKSINKIKRDSKPCPKCNILISKIDGCDHMWCTQCHTAFDWRTLKMLSGHVENPEYYAFMRQTHGEVPRHPEDDEDFVGVNLGVDFFRKWQDEQIVMNVVTYVLVLSIVELPRHLQRNEMDNLDLRIEFLRGGIDKDKLKATAQKRDKMAQKDNDIYTVLREFTKCTYNLINEHLVKAHDVDAFEQEMKLLQSDCNERFLKLSHVYGSQTFWIDWNDS